MPIGYCLVTADRVVTLLLIDESWESIQLIRDRVAEVGYGFRAINSRQVLDITRQQNFDLIMLDLTTSNGNFSANNAKKLRFDVENLPVLAVIDSQVDQATANQAPAQVWKNLLNRPLPIEIISHLITSIFHHRRIAA
jgi:CheY-like chemotaxis protein